MSERLQLPGETADQCRLRVMAESKATWNSDPALRSEYRCKAQETNKSNKSQLVVASQAVNDGVMVNSRVAPMKELYLRPVVQTTASAGVGPLGIGDSRFGLSVQLLGDTVDATMGFVKKFNNEWLTRAGGTVVSSTDSCQTPMKLSCFEEFGFCWNTLNRENRERFFQIETHLLRFMQDFRKKFIHNKKNKGPNADIKHPLLIATKGKLCYNSLRFYFESLT